MTLLKYITRHLSFCVLCLAFLQVKLFASLQEYYQSMLDKTFFYYDLNITIQQEYGDLLTDNITLSLKDVTIDSILNNKKGRNFRIDFLVVVDNRSYKNIESYQAAIYKEIQGKNYIGLIKLLTSEKASDYGNEFSLTEKESNIVFYKNSQEDRCNTLPKKYLYLNYIDYIIMNYNCYNFNVIKITPTYLFYKGILKKTQSNLFEEINLKFSKQHSLPVQVDFINRDDLITIRVDKLKQIAGEYVASQYVVYNNGIKSTVSREKIITGIPIEIENHGYKITFDEYIQASHSKNLVNSH